MRFTQLSVRVLFLAFLLFAIAGLAAGQGIVTGSIAGTVQDQQQAMVAGAKVTAKQQATGIEYSTTTNESGYYRFTNLPIGTYTVTIEAAKFSKQEVQNVVVATGRENTIAPQVMTVGGGAEVVTVEGSAPLVESNTAQVSATFTATQVAGLPSSGGGFDSLALLVPGIQQVGAASFSNTNGAAISSNGQRGRSNNFQIDGQANNDNSVAGPSIFINNPDVLQEFQVITSNFSAEYGRNMGSVVNYVTKAGTNSFHGSAFNYYTGNWGFARSNGQKNPVFGFCPAGVAAGTATTFAPAPAGCRYPAAERYVENRYGGSINGPIWKNKAWFFGAYQGDRVRTAGSPAATSTATPTPAGLTALQAAFPGNAAVAALVAIGPYSRTAGNPQPAGTAVPRLVTVGATSVMIPFANVTRSVSSLYNEHEAVARGDWQVTDKDRFFSRYVYEKFENAVAAGSVATGGWVDVPGKSQQISADWVRTWTSRFVSQARFSYSNAGFGFEGGSFPGCTRATITTGCPTSVGFLDGITSGFGLATNLPQGRTVKNTQYQSNLSYSAGRHTWKFGGEFSQQNSPAVFLPSINGGFTFASFNSFMSGSSAAMSLADGPEAFNFKEKDVSFYAQDDWRVRDNLTLQMGLRWEWNQQAINSLAAITRANQAQTPPFWSTAVPERVTTLPNIGEDLNNFAPSVGFAWTPRIWQGMFGQDKTVIRGGFRIAYDPAFYNIFLNVATAAPVVNLGTLTGTGVPASGMGGDVASTYLGSIPRGGNPGTRLQTRVSPDFHNPYTEQWSLSVQRQIGRSVAVESRYVGSHTVGNFQTVNGNPMISTIPAAQRPAGITPCATVGAAGFNRQDCDFSIVRQRTNGAFANYHGLQNDLRIQNFHGINAGATYTWSKTIDNVSEIFASGGGTASVIAQNPFDTSDGERGESAFSFPHVANFYYIYEIPWMKSQQGFMGRVFGGWQTSGSYRFQTGEPFNVVQTVTNPACDTGFNLNFIGRDACRPLLGNPAAPINVTGIFVPNSGGVATLVNISNCASTAAASVGTPACPAVAANAVHWIVNNALANSTLGVSPYSGIGRNFLRGQNRSNMDISLQKSTNISEKVKFTLRADAFNVFNRHYRGAPGFTVNSRNLTAINPTTGVATPSSFMNTEFNGSNRRFIQLMGRISF